MEETYSLEGCISLGPWGGPGGNKWRVKGSIKEIIIVHGGCIDSIEFKYDNGNDSKLGGNGGYKTDKVTFDWPMEYLTGISGSTGHYNEHYVVKSLSFHTNYKIHGPFGSSSGGSFSSSGNEGDGIVVFHGRAGIYLDAIGVYVKPKMEPMEVVVARDPGPWGGLGGKPWDDGVFLATKQVHVHARNGVIHALQFQYERRDGKTVWSQMYGRPGGEIINPNQMKLDGTNEFLVGISGFYGPIEENGGFEAIRSITFHTNKDKYGPFGEEIGKYFASGNSGGKIVGFHGRSSVYLDAIGVHMEYC